MFKLLILPISFSLISILLIVKNQKGLDNYVVASNYVFSSVPESKPEVLLKQKVVIFNTEWFMKDLDFQK